MKTQSGRSLPKMSNDFEIRFRDDGYHKKMVDTKRYKNNLDLQSEYKDELNAQLQEKAVLNKEKQSQELQEEHIAMQYRMRCISWFFSAFWWFLIATNCSEDFLNRLARFSSNN